jgi:hypothetical protein
MNLYVDGSLASPSGSSGSGMTASILSTTPFQLSGRGGAANLWAGYLDEVGIWSKVLSTNEITDLYNGGAGQTMCDGTGGPKCRKIIIISFYALPENTIEIT